jgi:hypothetical protein
MSSFTCEGWLEYLHTVALRFVEGDEKVTRRWEYNWATLSLGDITTGTWPSRLGVGLKAVLLCRTIVAKSKVVKTG